MANKALFVSTSDEKPSILTISFKDDPGGSLGTELLDCDKSYARDIFLPGFGIVHKLLDGETVARTCGVIRGDCIVGVSGLGFRRFPPDYPEDQLKDLTMGVEPRELTDEEKERKHRVIKDAKKGETFKALIERIKEIKAAEDPENPLELLLERHGWDSRANSLGRFLSVTDKIIVDTMGLLQKHEDWKEAYFPIDLTEPSLQEILKLGIVSEIGVHEDAPTIYIDYTKIQALEIDQKADDVIKAIIIYTEIMLASCPNPRRPKVCHLINMTGVKAYQGFCDDVFQKLYPLLETQYPDTLFKIVMYPIQKQGLMNESLIRAAAITTTDKHVLKQKKAELAKSIFNSLSETMQRAVVLVDTANEVCTELGWETGKVAADGGLDKFVEKHSKAVDDLIVEL
eukprot:CAMPEP_0194034680 /NCGR_PEP_ID=MMETSP0009_2-20130614/7105_1 /TAXON_ID=210454 /ORGANISM="Grammatophora oceanica, Strain CCMP 410" /LENGTH=398 /DNA_ID=CAMNT_0038675709 /DNA_START=20 /DNA_END=1216 /DNA_ORIENTATION=-